MNAVRRVTLFLTGSLAVLLVVLGCSKTAPQDGFNVTAGLNGIVGGTELAADHIISKSTVLLYFNKKEGLCSATIISPEFAITAAHCLEVAGADSFEPSFFELVFGTKYTATSPRRQVTWGRWPADRNQKAKTNAFDIALIRFSGGLPPGFQPAEILPDTLSTVFKAGIPVEVAGFGTADPLNEKIDTLRMAVVPLKNPAFTATEMIVGASSKPEVPGVGACKGDSGGPAFVFIKGKYYFWGVSSRAVKENGEPDTDSGCGKLVVYTNVLRLRDSFSISMEQMTNHARRQ